MLMMLACCSGCLRLWLGMSEKARPLMLMISRLWAGMSEKARPLMLMMLACCSGCLKKPGR